MNFHDPGSGLQPRNSGLKGPHTYAQPFLTSNGTWPTSLQAVERKRKEAEAGRADTGKRKHGETPTPKWDRRDMEIEVGKPEARWIDIGHGGEDDLHYRRRVMQCHLRGNGNSRGDQDPQI